MIYPNDPEGIFTTLTAFLNAYAGYWSCLVMQDYKTSQKRIFILWAIFSILFVTISFPLEFVMPFCKKIWSISFVFLTSGVSGFSLLFLTYVIDILGKNS